MSFLAWPLETNRIRRDVTNNTFGTVRRNADGTKRDHQGGFGGDAAHGLLCDC